MIRSTPLAHLLPKQRGNPGFMRVAAETCQRRAAEFRTPACGFAQGRWQVFELRMTAL